MSDILAFDRLGTVRVTDEDGRLRIARTHISKAAINPYHGREIPDAARLGLDPDHVYHLWRDPAELERAAETFNNLPLLLDHAHVTAQDPKPQMVVGATGSDAVFAAPYLDNSLCVWDARAIVVIESGERRALSCAYRYVPQMQPGDWQGQAYDGRMTRIRGNHVALVAVGRAGPDIVVADHKLMDGAHIMQNAGQYLARLGTAIAEGRLQLDAPLEAMRAFMDQCAAEDDLSPDDPTDPVDTGTASDAALRKAVRQAVLAERQNARDAHHARALVRPLVGDVVGMDSAEEIYRYALNQHGIVAQDVNIAGLKALVATRGAAMAQVLPQSATLAERMGVKAPRRI